MIPPARSPYVPQQHHFVKENNPNGSGARHSSESWNPLSLQQWVTRRTNKEIPASAGMTVMGGMRMARVVL
jgi:hypothetical protein